ncbi:LysR family transcriptional regulator [Bordetella tumulicola]
MHMNLRQLEVFRAIMISGSVSGAAQLLHVSQPAVSRLIAYTEQRLELVLFERIKGRLYATKEARQLFGESESIYQNLQRFNELAHGLSRQAGGALRIVCSPSLAHGLLPLAIAAFARVYPDVRITLAGLQLSDLVDRVTTQRADLAVAMVPLQHPHLQVHNVFRNRVVAVLPPGHRLLRKARIAVSDLRGERLIGYHPDTPLQQAIQQMFDAKKILPTRVAEVEQIHVACAMVQLGVGIALIDELAVLNGAWSTLEIRPIVAPIDLQVRLGYLRSEPLSGLAQTFGGMLENLEHPALHRVVARPAGKP